jgi:hypothetical protein
MKPNQKIFIRHRVNRVKDLASVQLRWGVEIDLRSQVSNPGSLHLSHDPWVIGDDFEVWLEAFKSQGIQGPIWLNTKEDGLEMRVIELMRKYQIENYCFLDTVLPTLIKKTQYEANPKFAIRLSAFEPRSFVDRFRGRAEWIWVDCFQGVPLKPQDLEPFQEDFKICLVSPELHGKSLPDHLSQFTPLLDGADAVCTKDPDLWRHRIP